MPYSSFQNLTLVMAFLCKMRPKRVLDVGIGWGCYGLLCRYYLDMNNPETAEKEMWETEIVGIEIHEGYHNPVWDYAYDSVLIGDAREVAPTLGRFDVAIFTDVIEHFPKEVGKKFLDELLLQCPYVILTAPRGFLDQGAIYENEAERHLAGWSKVDLACYHTVYRESGGTFIALISKTPIPKQMRRIATTMQALRRQLSSIAPVWMHRLHHWLSWRKIDTS